MTRRRRSYASWLRRELGAPIDDLELDERHKRYLRTRWLEQVLWTEERATQARDRYYALRLTTMTGAVLIPALVSLNVTDDTLDTTLRVVTWVVSVVVAVTAAVEQLFHFGERWRNYRRTAERLKSEGWLFFELGGPYSGVDHTAAFPLFVARVEELLKGDVDVYLSEIAVDRTSRRSEPSAG
jgi:Protein of unknown function (DUF4231)